MADTKLQALISALNAYGIHLQPKVATTPTPTPTPTTTHTESKQGTVVTTTGTALYNASLEAFTITNNKQIAVNGNTDTTTANVTTLLYYNHNVYQKNAAGNWYYKAKSSAAWNGPTTDPRSTSTPTPPITGGSGGFKVSNGKIIDPNGSVYIGKGINVYDGDMGSVSTSSDVTPLLTLFKKLKFIRMPCYSYDSPDHYRTFINQCTAKGIVVELEHHSGAGGGVPPLTGSALNDENNWFASLAAAYKDNPYVWFGTLNEPSGPGDQLTAQHVSNYNAIRNTGNNSMIMMEILGDYQDGVHYTVGNGHGLIASEYANMTNIIWDFHFYNGLPHFNANDGSGSYSTDQNFLNNLCNTYISQCQTIKSKDGIVPVIIGEYGIATDGQNVDPGGTQTCIAVQNSNASGSAAWNWASGAPSDNLTDGNGNLTEYGQQVANWINS